MIPKQINRKKTVPRYSPINLLETKEKERILKGVRLRTIKYRWTLTWMISEESGTSLNYWKETIWDSIPSQNTFLKWRQIFLRYKEGEIICYQLNYKNVKQKEKKETKQWRTLEKVLCSFFSMAGRLFHSSSWF